MLAGDTASNLLGRAYISFDISDLGGKTMVSANLDLTSCIQMGTVTNVGGIWVAELQYAVPLVQSDDAIADTGIVLLNAKPSSTIDVKSFVQTRVNQRKTRFQIRLHPANSKTNGDKKNDYISCASGVPKLKITYQ